MKKQIKNDLYYIQWLAEQTKDRKLNKSKKEIQEYIEKKIQEIVILKKRNKNKIEKIYMYEDYINGKGKKGNLVK